MVLDYIRKGIQARSFFPYDNFQLTLRPITSMELDDAERKAGDMLTPRLTKLLVDVKMGRINPEKFKFDEEIPEQMYLQLRNFYMDIDYWIVYYSMKDFMPQDFTIEDVRKMTEIHRIAQHIMDISTGPKDLVLQTINSSDGQRLVDIVRYYHVPLTDAAWKLTPLQEDFLYWSVGNSPIYAGETLDDAEKVMRAILNERS